MSGPFCLVAKWTFQRLWINYFLPTHFAFSLSSGWKERNALNDDSLSTKLHNSRWIIIRVGFWFFSLKVLCAHTASPSFYGQGRLNLDSKIRIIIIIYCSRTAGWRWNTSSLQTISMDWAAGLHTAVLFSPNTFVIGITSWSFRAAVSAADYCEAPLNLLTPPLSAPV